MFHCVDRRMENSMYVWSVMRRGRGDGGGSVGDVGRQEASGDGASRQLEAKVKDHRS